MSYFVVRRVPGAAWDRTRRIREQDRWDEHAAFMDGLAAEGLIVLGGPLGEDPDANLSEVLLIVAAESVEQIAYRLEDDPWVPMGLLYTSSIEPWKVLLGDLATEAARRRAAEHGGPA